MKQRHQVIPRTMCFVFYGDEVLLLKAGEKKEWTGTYDPLGGHIEKGESIIASAEREIKEESGLTVSGAKLRGIVHVSGFFGKEIMMFVTASKAPSKKVVANHEGELEWVSIDKLNRVKVFEDVKPILRQVLQLKSEELFVGVSRFDGKDKLLALDIKVN